MKDRLKEFHCLYEENVTEEDMYMLDLCDLTFKSNIPPRLQEFLNKCTFLQKRLNLVLDLVHELQQKQIGILTATSIDPIENKEREELLIVIKENVTYINADIADLEKRTDIEKPYQNRFNREDKIKRDQVAALRLEFQDVMFDFNTTQLVYRDQCISRIRRQLEICGSKKKTEEIEEMLENDDIDIFKKQIFADTEKAAKILEDVTERHTEILNLEKSLQELHQIFQDIALIVENQGDMLNSIENNVKETVQTMNVIVPTMKAAYRYKRRKLLTLCIPCVACM